MLKTQLTILAFFSLNLTFAQYTPEQNSSQNSTFSFNLDDGRLVKFSGTNFSDYSNSNALNTQDFSMSENLVFAYPSFVSTDSTAAKQKWYKTDTGTSLIIAGGLIATGTLMHFNTSFKVGVRDDIQRYLPDFENDFDDYAQYAPYAAVFAFDAAGIRSQHSSLRKVSTIGTAIAINLAVVQGMKYSIAEPRPDGSSNNSFPSGHTATAFMGAHLFHKEYKHKSPFYSIAAYTLATVTGVFRQLNNRHWVSDVFAGAGIGIGTTELAYFLNDGWWKDKGINEIEETIRLINESKPSFLGLKVGYASLVEQTEGEDVAGLSYKSGFRFSFEGAYFLTKSFGIGGEIGFQSFPITINRVTQENFNAEGYELIPEATGNRLYYFGPYYQIPFGKNAIGTKLQAGVISGPNTRLALRALDQPEDEIPVEILYADFDPQTTFSWATGLYYKRYVNKNISLGVYFDYNIGDLEYSVVELDDLTGGPNGEPTYLDPVSIKTKYDSYAIGTNINIMLW
jgi:hypothetical protein